MRLSVNSQPVAIRTSTSYHTRNESLHPEDGVLGVDSLGTYKTSEGVVSFPDSAWE